MKQELAVTLTRGVVVHYHELALKGRNRSYFEQRLTRNLRATLKNLGITHVTALNGRIHIGLKDDQSWEPVKTRIARVFGISHFSESYALPLDPDSTQPLQLLKEAIGSHVQSLSFDTFRVSAKRADKRFSFTSMDVEKDVGAHVCELTGKRVNLKRPELTISVEVLSKQIFFSVQREPGAGGLPVGVSGKVACLISGGIDSPVAAYRLMKRGCHVVFIHFHGRPYVSRASEEKVQDIVRLLTTSQLHSRLHLVPFGDIQRQIVLSAPTPTRIILYRRMMMRIAERLAKRDDCWALVTGDSLGQVASQTAENMTVVEEAASLPILRPLIGMDKIEITDQAEQIGTFETSIEPDQDCCSLFVPPHPIIRAQLAPIQKIEEGLDITGMIQQGIEQTELLEFTFPS